MVYHPKDLMADKIKLIYEFNASSPLFARVALYEIEKGDYLRAIDIIEAGLKHHLEYATAHFILAIAYSYIGDEIHAKEEVETGVRLSSSKYALDYYNKKIEKIISERNSLTDVKRPAFTVPEIEEENKHFKLEDRLDELADELSKAKIKVDVSDSNKINNELPEFKGKKIASETLAGIYVAQRNFMEAISIYNELIKAQPAKEGYYNQKIIEINRQL